MLEKIFQSFILLLQTGISLLKILLQSYLFLEKTKTKESQCIILGNGPSLKIALEQHSKQLAKKRLLCVNNFPNTPHYETLRPQYFIITAEEFWNDKQTIDPNTQLRKEIIDAFIQKTTWPVIFLLPASSQKSKPFLKRVATNPNIKTFFYNKTPLEGNSNFLNWSYQKGWGMPRPHNVLIPALMTMINADFQEIILLGADHSWIPLISVNDKNEAMVAQKHFYDPNAKKDIMYRSGVRPRRLHEILEKFMLSFKAYFDIKRYAEKRNVQIWNTTPNSFIDAFDRKPLDDFL